MLTIRLASETREVITETQIVVLLLTLALFALVLFGASIKDIILLHVVVGRMKNILLVQV